MRHAISTDIEIDAPPERVWRVLTDFASYPDWNPFVTRIAGDLSPGAKLTVRLQPPGGLGMTIKPRIVEHEAGKSFAWRGQLGIRGLFDGAHRFEVSPLPGNRTRLVHSEQFGGVLVRLMKKNLDGGVRNGFIAMNEAVKRRVESQQRG
jgi:hypothetical protein